MNVLSDKDHPDGSGTTAGATSMPRTRPESWSSDVVLADGGTVHVRAISPADAGALVAFHEGLSSESVYFRFFSPHPHLLPDEVERFTNVDHEYRVALVAELGDRLIAVGRYDRQGDSERAEVAFIVADEHHGRGIGTVLLEDLAAIARERGVVRFFADVLPGNAKMLRVFRDAGFSPTSAFESGVVRVEFTIEPTEASRAAVEQREHRAEARSIARLLTPRSVAVIGASRSPSSVGHQVIANLLGAGFDGSIYPINPHAETIAGLPALPSIMDVPGGVDLVVIAVPSPGVLDALEQSGAAGAKGAIVLTAGFGEMGGGGADLQARLRHIIRRYGLRVIGPNCIGAVNTANGLDATFASYRPPAGSVAMQSQSGAIGIALLELASRIGLGVSSFVSVGNKVDVSGNDLLQYWEDDPATDVILLYLESFGNPRKFARLARRVSRRKPIVALKSGRTAAGSRAAGSHTAALASSEDAVDALFRQAGIVRVDTIDQLFDMAIVLTLQPLPTGRRVAIVGNSGGPGVLAADACGDAGLTVGELSEETRLALRELADPNAAVGNPVDLVASATPDTFELAVGAVLRDPDVDAVVTICTPTLFAPPAEVAAALRRAARGTGKPVLASFLAWPDMPAVLRSEQGVGRDAVSVQPRDSDDRTACDGHLGDEHVAGEREGADLPAFSSPEPAVVALGRAARYAEWRRRDPGTVPPLDGIDVSAAKAVVDRALSHQPEGTWLPPADATELLRSYGIPVAPVRMVTDEESAVLAADALGYPVALKATGPDLVHKSDIGGVALGLDGRDAVCDALARMRRDVGGKADGFAVQPMVAAGVETIIGIVQDRLFGPLVMFGMGGTTAELLRDNAFRILPVTDVDAHELVRSIRCAPLLFGYRGQPPADTARLEDLLVRVARLAGDVAEIAELDLNPVVVNTDGAIAVDAKIRVAPRPLAAPDGLRQMT